MGSHGQIQRPTPLDDLSPQSVSTNDGAGTSTPCKAAEFVVKLFAILEDMKEQYSSIIAWSEDGKSFAIHDVSKFTEQVLPTIYKHRNLSSFVRQLNKYSFHKVKASESGFLWPNTWAYRHEHFHSSGRHDLENVKRQIPDRKVVQESGETSHRSLPLSIRHADDNMSFVSHEEFLGVLDQLQALTNKLAETEARLAQVELQLLKTKSTGQINTETSEGDITCTRAVAEAPSEMNTRVDPSSLKPLVINIPEQISPSQSPHGSPVQLQQPETFTTLNSSTLTNSIEQSVNPSADISHSVCAMFPVQSPQPPVWTSDNAVVVPANTSTSLNSSYFPNVPNPTNYRDIFFSQFGGHEDEADQLWSSTSNTVSWNPVLEPVYDSSRATAEDLVENTQGLQQLLNEGTRHIPRVLLVGDSAVEVESSSTLFKHHGYQVVEVFRNSTLLNSARSAIFDFVFVDSADPIPLIRLIRSFDSVTPIICSSSRTDTSLLYAQGANEVITRPFTKSGLLEIIKKHTPLYTLPPNNPHSNNPPFYGATERMDEDHWGQVNGGRNASELESSQVCRLPAFQKRTSIEVNDIEQQQKRVRYS